MANESIGGIKVNIVGDYTKLSEALRAAIEEAQRTGQQIAAGLISGAAGAEQLSKAVAEAMSAISAAARQTAAELTAAFSGLAIAPPEVAAVLAEFASIVDAAETASANVASSFGDTTLAAPDTAPVDAALSGVTDSADTAAGELATSTDVTLAAPDASAVSDTLTGTTDAATAAGEEVAAATGVDLAAPDASPVDAAFEAVTETATEDAGSMAEAFSVPLETPDASPVSDELAGVTDVASAAANEMAGDFAVPLESPDIAPATDALAGVADEAANDAEQMAAEFAAPLEVPDTSPATEALATVPDVAESAAEEMAGDFDRPLESPDIGPVTDALAEVPNAAAESADEMATDFSLPLEAPDASPVIEAIDSVPPMAADAADQMAGDFGLPLSAPDVAPVTGAIDGLDDAAQGIATQMAADFAVPLQAPDAAPVTTVIGTLDTTAKTVAGSMAADFGVPLQAPDVAPVTDALQEVTTKAADTGKAVDELGARIAELLASGEAATTLEALAMAEAEVADKATGAAVAISPLSGDISAAGDAADVAADNIDDLAAAAISAGDAASGAASEVSGLGGAVDSAGTEASGTTPEVKDFSAATDEAGISSHILAESLGEMAGELGKLTGIALTTAALAELANEALHASDNIGDATHSMGVLGGSAKDAEVAVDKLRAIADDERLSFPGLLTAAVNMTNFLGSSKQVPEAIAAIGNATETLHKSLDGAVAKFDMMVSSGDVSKRSLMALGLTLGDLAGALGTTESKAKDVFKALDDEPARVDVLVAALGRFNGEAHILGDDTFGNLTVAANRLHVVLKELGDDLEPITYKLSALAADAVPKLSVALKDVIVIGAVVVTGIKAATDAIIGMVTTTTEVIKGYVTVWADLMAHNFTKAASDAKDAFGNIQAVSEFSWKSIIKDGTDAGTFIEGIWKKTKTAADDAGGGVKRLTGAFEEQVSVVLNVHHATRDFVDTAGKIPTAEQAAANATEAHQAKLALLSTELDHSKQRLDEAATAARKAQENYDLWGGSLGDLEIAQRKLGEASDAYLAKQAALDKELGEVSKPAVDALTMAFGVAKQSVIDAGIELAKIPGLITPIAPTLTPVQEAFKTLGLGIDDTTTKTREQIKAFDAIATDANTSLTQVKDAWDKVGASVNKLAKENLPEAIKQEQIHTQSLIDKKAPLSEIYQAQEKLLQLEIQQAINRGEDASKYVAQLDQIKQKLKELQDPLTQWQHLQKDVFDDLDKGWTNAGKAIADNLVDLKDWGDVGMGILKAFSKEILEDVVGTGFKALKGAILDLTGLGGSGGGLLGGLTGGANAAGSALGSVTSGAQAAGSAASTAAGGMSSAGSAASGVGGAFGSLGGTINVISGAISAVTGVVGLFQNAAMGATMKLVELNTRISAIVESKELPLANQIAVEQIGTLHDISTFTSFIPDISTHTANILAFNEAMRADLDQMAGNSDYTVADLDGIGRALGVVIDHLSTIRQDSDTAVHSAAAIAAATATTATHSATAASATQAAAATLVTVQAHAVETVSGLYKLFQVGGDTATAAARIAAGTDQIVPSVRETAARTKDTMDAVERSRAELHEAISAVERTSVTNKDGIVQSVHGTGEFIAGRNDTAEESTRTHIASRIDRLGTEITQAVGSVATIIERTGRDHTAAVTATTTAVNTGSTAITGAVDRDTGAVISDTGNTTNTTGTNTAAILAIGNQITTGVGANIQALGAQITAATAAANAAAASNLQDRLVAGSPVIMSTVEQFFAGEMIAHGQIPDWAQRVIDEVKALGVTIPLNLDASNRLTFIDTNNALGSIFYNQNLPRGGFDYANISRQDPNFKADPATWNAMVDALLATGSIQQVIANLQANIDYANAHGAGTGSGGGSGSGAPPPGFIPGGSGFSTGTSTTASYLPPTLILGSGTTASILDPNAHATAEDVARAIEAQEKILNDLKIQAQTLNNQLIIAAANGNADLVNTLNQQLGTVNGKITSTNTLISQLTTWQANLISGSALGSGVTSSTLDPNASANAAQLAQAIAHEQQVLNDLKSQAATLNQQLIVAAASGNDTLVATLNTRLSALNGQIKTQGDLLGLLTAQQATGNTTAVDAAAAAAAAAAAQIAALNGTVASADQIKHAIATTTATLGNLKAEQAQLQQSLIQAVAMGDTNLIAAIQKQLNDVNGQINTTNSLLLQLNNIVATTPGAPPPTGGGGAGSGGSGGTGNTGDLPGFFGIDATKSIAEQMQAVLALINKKTLDMQYDFAAGNVTTGQLLQREIAQLQAWIQGHSSVPAPGGLPRLFPTPTGSGGVPPPPPSIPSFDVSQYESRQYAQMPAGPVSDNGSIGNIQQTFQITVSGAQSPDATANAIMKRFKQLSAKGSQYSS